MSSENKPETAAAGLVENLKSNPKAMAAAAVVVGLAVFLLVKGSSSEGEKPAKVAAVSVGQTVTVQNPNIGNTILLAAPGAVGLADSDNDKDDMIICRHVVSGTTAVINEESTVNYIPFVKITLNDGECAGKTGWMAKVNIAQ
jgi:ABC-type oligopeptide transport system substrate-binding subunit